MRGTDSLFATPSSSVSDLRDRFGRWQSPAGTRVAAAVLGFLAVVLIPIALYSATDHPSVPSDPELACATIDGRVGRKLTILAGFTDTRSAAIHNSITHQREIARAQCRAGLIDEAMIIYRLIDKASTRYVERGTAATLRE